MTAADTIFALSTGAPPAAIAIMRISGAKAFPAVEALARRHPPPRMASLARLYDPQGSGLLDEALLLLFPGPDSATGEDLAELHLHGGKAVVKAVETALGKIDGLRAAEAGEFTRRAFLNGRIDLNQADALGDLLTAETEWQRRAAATMLGGKFGAKIEEWREELLRLSARVEADLDFSDEDDVDSPNSAEIISGCVELYCNINEVLALPAAEKLRDGLRIVLGGPPNSGKSTLLNALVDRDAAIVSDIAGTTRDVIDIPVWIEGVPLVFVDTAGVHDGTGDKIEAIGIARAQQALDSADVIVWLGPEGEGPDHPSLLEIEPMIDSPNHLAKQNAIRLSAATGEGMAVLIQTIVDRATTLLPPPDHVAVNERQRGGLGKASAALLDASAATDPLIIAEQLRQARMALDALTGRAHTEEMLDVLFGRFCIGK